MGAPLFPLVSDKVCAKQTWANLHGLYVHFGLFLALNKWQICSLTGRAPPTGGSVAPECCHRKNERDGLSGQVSKVRLSLFTSDITPSFAREALTEEHWIQARPAKVFSLGRLSPTGSNVLGSRQTFEVVAALEDCSLILHQFRHHVGVSLQ